MVKRQSFSWRVQWPENGLKFFKRINNMSRSRFKKRPIRTRAILLFLCLFSLTQILLSQNEAKTHLKKIALIIGVSDYTYAPPLKNPLNDVDDIGSDCKKFSYEVELLKNPNNKELGRAIDSFILKMNNADVCLFFFSGHGAEYEGENYLFPKDANPIRPADLKYETFPLNRLLENMDLSNVKTKIILLDACRSNPFMRSWKKEWSAQEGLAETVIPSGTFIGYAASPGKTASDGKGRNGIYTAAIRKFNMDRSLDIDHLFTKVNKEVRMASDGKQIPYKNSSLDDNFCFACDDGVVTIPKVNANLPDPYAPPYRPLFTLPKTVRGYTRQSINSYAIVSLNKTSFSEMECIELSVHLLKENIWDKVTPIYVSITRNSSSTERTNVYKEEFRQSDCNAKIRFASSFEPGLYNLEIGFYFISELNAEFPPFHAKVFTINIL